MSKSKITQSAANISKKWQTNTKQSVPYIVAGIDAVTESPMEKAAAKEQKMLTNLTASVTSGKWANSLRNVPLSDWKEKTKAKVSTRLAGGVDGAMMKRQAFDESNIATINAVLPTIAAMPDLTLEDSVNRVRTYMEHMRNNPYKK